MTEPEWARNPQVPMDLVQNIAFNLEVVDESSSDLFEDLSRLSAR